MKVEADGAGDALVAADDDKRVSLDADATCMVCLMSFEVGDTIRMLPCGHLFHEMCIDTWYPSKKKEKEKKERKEKGAYITKKQNWVTPNPACLF